MTRPDCAYQVKELSRHLSNPTHTHMVAAKRVARYLYHTKNLGVVFNRNDENLIGYSDSNFGNCIDTRRSTGGYVTLLYGSPVSWQSKLQDSISHSTAEAEMRALNTLALETRWLRRMVSEVTGDKIVKPTPLHCDNRATEMWTRNPHHRAKQKHMERAEFSVRDDVCVFKTIVVHLVPTQTQLSDCFTKSLPLPAFKRNVQKLLGDALDMQRDTTPNCQCSAQSEKQLTEHNAAAMS